jgi:hypothetical protein
MASQEMIGTKARVCATRSDGPLISEWTVCHESAEGGSDRLHGSSHCAPTCVRHSPASAGLDDCTNALRGL